MLLGASSADAEDRLYVPEGTEVEPSTFWLVGIVADRTADTILGGDLLADQLVGLYVGHRWGWFELNGKLMLSANLDGFGNTRSLSATTLRVAFDLLGLEWTYGIGAHLAVRLEDHYWLSFVTPCEIAAVVVDAGSWHIQALVGLRYLFAGQLIDHYLIDPNGFDNENARDALGEEKDTPLEAFVGIAFTREID